MKHYWVKQLAMLKEWESGDIESRWGIEAVGSSKVTTNSLLPSGSPFGDPGPHGDLFQFLGPQKVPIFFPRSPFSLFQA